jgi:argininosuccinate lyase
MLLGHLASVAAVGKTYSGNPDSRVFIYGELPRAFDRAAEAMRLLSATLTGITLNEELLRARATEGFSQATDLADVIMTSRGIDYRTAHQIVGRLVRSTLEAGVASTAVTSAMVDEAAVAVTGAPLELKPEELASALEPGSIVASRQGLGGAASERLEAMFVECGERLAREKEWITATRKHLAGSQAALLSRAEEIAHRVTI